MWRHPILTLLAAGYIGWGAWHWFEGRPVAAPDGVLAPGEPLQVDLKDGGVVPLAGWTLKIRAHYEITARILGIERYRFDALASLIPEDLALGWGPMSDSRTLRRIDISQSNRFYYWREPKGGPLPPQAIIAHSANTHVIPADPLVARELGRLRPGETVTLSGDLVDAARADGTYIRTSLSRTDTGAGACEVMLVRDVEVEPYP